VDPPACGSDLPATQAYRLMTTLPPGASLPGGPELLHGKFEIGGQHLGRPIPFVEPVAGRELLDEAGADDAAQDHAIGIVVDQVKFGPIVADIVN
jgi:hypothetical protein